MQRRELNVADLPSVVFSHRSLIWWGTAGLMVIEGTMFAMTVASYFYLRTRSSEWPPGLMPPRLLAGTLNLAVFLASVAPAVWVQKASERGDLKRTQLGLVIMSLVGLVNLGLRVWEFPSLMSTW